MKKLSRRTSEMLRRAGSMLLAIALVMTGITVPQMQVQAAAIEKTFYYYYEGDEIPVVLMKDGVYTAGAESADYTYTNTEEQWSVSFYEMTKDDANEGWYSVAMSYDNTATWGEFGLYTIPEETVSGNTLSSMPSNCVLTGDAYKKTDTTIREAFDAGKFYYKGGSFYESMEAADGAEITDIKTTLYIYVGDVQEAGLFYWGSGFTTTNDKADWCLWDESSTYEMTAVEGNAGWYSFPITITAGTSDEAFGFTLCSKDGTTKTEICKFDAWNNEDVWASIFAGGTVAVYDYTTYTSLLAANVARLQALVTKAEGLTAEDYSAESYAAVTTAVAAAKKVIEAEEPTTEAIYSAYKVLEDAMAGLVSSVLPAEAEIYVEKIDLPDGFIKGVDISSFLSLVESGVTYKDFEGEELDDQGFFDLLAEAGINYVRLRVWNNPYDENGNGYGGGNNDLVKAVTMGKLATNAGMRVLIDFHYSDFWADPGKQQSPLEWKDMDLETRATALSDYTKESLRTLLDAGVDVGMVQVGNETTGGMAGVKPGDPTKEEVVTLFKAGADAVYAIEGEYERDIQVALHFTDPQSHDFEDWAGKFDEAGLEYDVFATSYYPYWHGTLDNLKSELSAVATKYDKKVMVAETSYAYTLEDFDGHPNTVRVGNNDTSTTDPFTVQGQADSLSGVIDAVAHATNGIGVFYWEPAWLPVGIIEYDENGNPDAKQLEANKALWEKYGSGWASSYASVYDPDDAGLWYGGSAIENQALFDPEGYPLDTLNIFKYIDSGATTERVAIAAGDVESTIYVGETYEVPETVTVTYSYGDDEDCAVVWSAEDLDAVSTEKSGVYKIGGTVTANDAAKTKLTVNWTLKVIPKVSNLLANGSFEKVSDNDDTLPENWTSVANSGEIFAKYPEEDKDNNPYIGDKGLHFYGDGTTVDFTLSQKLENAYAGKYTFSIKTQGGTGFEDTITAAIELTKAGETEAYATYTGTANYMGWNVWQTPTVSDVLVGEGDTITVKLSVVADKNDAWGTIDDAILTAEYFVETAETENGTIKSGVDYSAAGEYVTFDVTPDEGYIAKNITVSGNNAALDYVSTDVDGRYKFMMPSYPVVISADFEDAAGTIDVSGNNIKVTFEDANYDTKVVNGVPYPVYPVIKGKAVMPKISVSLMDGDKFVAKLTEGKDYTVKYANNKAASTEEKMASVTITAKAGGKCIADTKATKYFWLEATAIKNIATLTVNGTTTKLPKFKVAAKPFTGEGVKVTFGDSNEIAIKDGEYTLVEGTDFITVYSNNVNVSKKASVLIIGKGNYTGNATLKYQITKKALVEEGQVAEGITITVPRSQTYTGSAVKPVVTVKYGANTLKAGKDYTIKYANNVKASTKDVSGNAIPSAKVTITGKGNYSGTSVQYFKIYPKTIKSRSIVITEPVLTANGKAQKIPALKITFGKKKLTTKDYTTVLKDVSGNVLTKVKDAGTYTLEVSGKGNYTGTTEVALKVVDKAKLMKNAKVGTIPAQTYYASKTGVTLPEGTLVVKDKAGNPLTEGTHYTVSYLNNIKAGKAKVVITGIGEYVGSIQKTFKINAKQMAASKYEEAYPFTVSVIDRYDSSVADAYTTIHGDVYTGYAVKPVYQVKDGDVVLTEGKDYTIKYSNNTKVTKYDVSGNVVKGATAIVQGKGNYAGKMNTIKFEVRPLDISDLTITVADAVYTGKTIKPAVTFKYNGQVLNLKAKTAYTIAYDNNKNATDNATVTIKAKGLTDKNEIGSVVKTFSIEKATITSASIAAVKVQSYAGKAVTPKLTVKVGKRTLKAGTDYKVTYKNNGNRGIATATVIGIGNYEGSGTVRFTIK